MPVQIKKGRKPGAVSNDVGNYEKHPFFVKKAAAAKAFLQAHGLPEALKQNQAGSKNQHVVPHHDGWAVEGSGNRKVTIVTKTQKEAIERAREIARNQKAEVFIHDRNGQIRDKDSYSKKK